MICFGAAVCDRSGHAAGALSVSMVRAAVDADRAAAAANSIMALADALTARLGGQVREQPAEVPPQPVP